MIDGTAAKELIWPSSTHSSPWFSAASDLGTPSLLGKWGVRRREVNHCWELNCLDAFVRETCSTWADRISGLDFD